MQIDWKIKHGESPYFFRHQAEWTGVKIHRARVVAGSMPEHTPLAHEINISISGDLVTEKVSAAGKIVTTRTGDGNLCLTPAGQPIGARWNEPIDNLGILLDPQFVSRTAAENRFPAGFEFAEIYRRKDPLVEQIGLTLLAESESETPAGRLFADSLIQTLTLHLLKNYTTADPFRENAHGGLSGYRLRRVKDYIEAHLEEDLSLAELATIADLSQFHFARAFRRSTGQTPQQFVMHRRIERAKELLAENDLPIVEISLRTGFKNQSHFTALFRKFTKLTPKTWRDIKLA